MIALARRVRGRRIRVLIDSGSTGIHISAQYQASLELEVQPEVDIEQLTIVDGSDIHAEGYVRFLLHCGDYKCNALAHVFLNL